MKSLSEEKKSAMRSWLREPAAETFAEVIRRGKIDRLAPSITASVDNHGSLSYLIGKQDGLEEVLKEMRSLARK